MHGDLIVSIPRQEVLLWCLGKLQNRLKGVVLPTGIWLVILRVDLIGFDKGCFKELRENYSDYYSFGILRLRKATTKLVVVRRACQRLHSFVIMLTKQRQALNPSDLTFIP